MEGHPLIGAMEVIRCPVCDWQSPVFRTPLSAERASEIDALVANHKQSHASEQAPQT
jgi:hypothetical protein